jgi:hypothetical protein
VTYIPDEDRGCGEVGIALKPRSVSGDKRRLLWLNTWTAWRIIACCECRSDKQRTIILPKPIQEAVKAHLYGRERYIPSMAKIRAISRPGRSRGLLDDTAGNAGLQETRMGK